MLVGAGPGNELLQFCWDADRSALFFREAELWDWLSLDKSFLVIVDVTAGNLVFKVVGAGTNLGIRIISHHGACPLAVIIGITRAAFSQAECVTALFVSKVDSVPMACFRHLNLYLILRLMCTWTRCVLHQPVVVLQASSKKTSFTLVFAHIHALMVDA